MQNTLKRLELIKTAITIEDEEIIELQVIKLNAMEYSAELESILNKIADKDYGNVVLEIEGYLQRFSGVVVYEDKELQGLRLELKALEKKLQDLSSEKNEYLNDIHEFNVQYHLHLGGIIQKILNLKEELLFASVQKAKDAFEDIKSEYETIKEEYRNLKSQKDAKEQELEELDEFDDGYDELHEELQALKDELNEKEKELNEKRKKTKQAKEEYEEDEVTQEYEDVKRDSEEFNKEYEEVKQEERLEISDEEKQELKKLFRQASRLCHPDLVSDELKEQAHDIMQQLNEAYDKRDLNTVKKILISLESGKGFDVASDTITDKDLLRSKIVDVRDMIYQNEVEIETIKEDEVIHILDEYDDIEDYFSALEKELESEYDRLESRDTNILSPEKNHIEKRMKTIWNWADHNQIDEKYIPRNTEDLLELTELRLSSNNLSDIPSEICDLTKLQSLWLGYNNLEMLPNNIADLCELTTLLLTNNKLISLPVGITKLEKLQLLALDENNIQLTTPQIEWINELKRKGCTVVMSIQPEHTDEQDDYWSDEF